MTLSSGLLCTPVPLYTSVKCMSTSVESMRFHATARPRAIAAMPEAGAMDKGDWSQSLDSISSPKPKRAPSSDETSPTD